MASITALTFVIGEEAAAAVGKQLNATAAYLRRGKAAHHHRDAMAVARLFDAQLRAKPDAFDLTICMADSRVRIVWQGEGSLGGLLFVIEEGVLRTINLLIPGTSPKAESRTIARAQNILGPVAPYRGCFDLVCKGDKPLIATFCANGGQVTRGVELALFTFASVLFGRSQVDTRINTTTASPSR
jgi:hypothetical protein